MFKERLITTLKILGQFFGYALGAIAFIAFVIWIASINANASDKVANWMLSILFGIIVLIFVIGILVWIWRYIEWQFIEPYKEWKNRRRKNNGEYH